MIVLDANILLYAYNAGADQHSSARDYLEEILSSTYPVGIPLHCVTAFVRISTQRGILRAPYSMKEALDFVNGWLALPHVRLLVPGERHWTVLQRILVESSATGKLITDAEVAAITIEYGGELQTNDRDFARFPGLRWHNPLAKA